MPIPEPWLVTCTLCMFAGGHTLGRVRAKRRLPSFKSFWSTAPLF